MKKTGSLFFKILLVLISEFSYAQPGKFFTVDNELSSSMIHDVFQDHFGQIWIATEDGLNRYDASKFLLFKKNDNLNSPLSNFSHFIFQDSQKNLLIGFGNGLQLYDFATNAFKRIPLITNNQDSLDAFVTSAIERKNGDILISTSGYGLYKLINDKGFFIAQQVDDLIPSLFITKLYEDKHENLWASTQDKGLFCISKVGSDNYFANNESLGVTITSFCEDFSGIFYAGSARNGLFEFNRNLKSFTSFSLSKGLPINSLHLSKDGEIYMGTEGEGLKLYNPENRKISEVNFSISNFDFSRSKVSSILEDKSGNIWLGIYQKGVVMLPASSNDFEYIGYRSIKSNIIGSSSITALSMDHEGLYWIGTDGDGIYLLDKNRSPIAHYFSSADSKDVPVTVMTIFEDSNKNLWFGSYDKGLVQMERENGRFQLMNHLISSESNRVTPIFSLAEDRYNNLWIGTLGAGLFKYNLHSNEVNHYEAVNGQENPLTDNNLPNRWINSLIVSSDEKLYIGTVVGLGCFDLKTESFTTTFEVNQILEGQAISTLYEDKSGMIWIGSSNGIKILDPHSKNLTSFSSDDGLPSDLICAITQDNLDNYWISTNYGISKMNVATGDFINYYAYDGLQGNEFNMRCVNSDDNGVIMFGGINGITLFNPQEIRAEGKKLDVYFTGFYIHDQAVNAGMKSGPYEIASSPVIDATEFNLAHTDNSFTIEFSAMEFSNPERIVYMYKIDDEETWIKLRPGANNVTFNNLSPGEYRFKVRAKDYNTYSDTRQVSIIIHPPWYFSTWAKLAYFIIFSLIGAFLILQVKQRIRTKRRIQQHIQTKQVNEAKLQFFINIAHEIRTPMTLIINPLKKLMGMDEDSERQKTYSTINRNSKRILQLIDQLMDIQKIDQKQMLLKFQEIELVEFIEDLCLMFEVQAANKNIELKFRHQMNNLIAWIDPNNFDKVILNILSNALKFTPENGSIKIELLTIDEKMSRNDSDGFFQLKISDSGIGIPDNEKEKVFECFYQTSSGRKVVNEGTGIGLHLSRSIVQLHHGNIWIENNPNRPGTSFIIQLPLGANHLTNEEILDDSLFELNKVHSPLPLSLDHNIAEELKVISKNKSNILIVDDDLEILNYLSEELSESYSVHKCTNGKDALAFALKNNPELIISDVMMPVMNGTTLCQKVKQNVNINHIPVILLTAKSKVEDNIEGLGIGADAYLTKPFNIEILKKTVENILRNRRVLKNRFSGNQEQNDKIKDVVLKSPDEVLLQKVINVINENIGNSALNVEMLSQEIGISRVHLHRKLKGLTNQSTASFIRNIRLHQAANLLRNKTPMNVSEVAYAVGFTSVAHFSNAFKEFYGEPPTAFMEVHLNRRSNTKRNIM